MRKSLAVTILVSALLYMGTVNSAPSENAMAVVNAENTENQEGVSPKALDYIAIVNGEHVPMGAYVSALKKGLQKRFYHGKIPEEEGKKFRKEIAEEMVEKALLVQEAKRQKMSPDEVAVDISVKAFDAKYKENPKWSDAREAVLPQIRVKLQNESLAMVLESSVRDVKEPTVKELQTFYEKNKDLFTTPAKTRVSLILLRVDPSSTSEVWTRASDEAASIVKEINAGAAFSEMARIHSSDKSSQNGGDMGFVHTGMLGENAQKVVDIMEPGDVSAPVVLLEGVSIFRLEERSVPKLNEYEVVKVRAGKLYLREKAEEKWAALIEKLHANAVIEYNDAPWR